MPEPIPIVMPRLGMTMEEGTVIAWPVPLGGRVERGEVVLVIESEKAEVEVEATATGFLRHIYVQPGETVPCGTLLALATASADEPVDAEAARARHETPSLPSQARREAEPTAGRASGAGVSAAAPAGPRQPVTPRARRLARELGVDVSRLSGTGPGGRVTEADVQRYADEGAPPDEEAERPALAPGAERIEVEPGVELEVHGQGTGGNGTLLLLPGFGVDLSVFSRQVPALAKSHRVVGLHPRGVGASDLPVAARYSVARYAADAAAVAAATASGPLHVLGASLGAAAALELALLYPERLSSLVLITPVLGANPRLLAVLESWCALSREARPEHLAEALLPWLFAPRSLLESGSRARLRRGLATVVSRAAPDGLDRWAAGLADWLGTRTEELDAVDLPTLVLLGAEDLLVPADRAPWSMLPRGRIEILPDIGHALTQEADDVLDELLAAHLRRSA